MMQPGFAGTCPTCGVAQPWQQFGPQMMGGMGPMAGGFMFNPAWQGGMPGFAGGWGPGATWGGTFAPGFAPFGTTAGYGLGGLRRWGGTYTPQYTTTGLPTDEEITEMVYDAIDDDPLIPWDAEINVEVDAGEVTLTGTVPNKRIKHAAGDDAWWIPGVTDVHNEIQVTGRHRARGAEEAEEAQPQPMRRGRAAAGAGR